MRKFYFTERELRQTQIREHRTLGLLQAFPDAPTVRFNAQG